jgi:apolipoprotein N-acyltransferase
VFSPRREELTERAGWLAPSAAAVVAGGLMALALPRPDFYHLVWMAPVPLLWILLDRRSWVSAAVVGWLAGAAFFASTCYWIVWTMSTYGGLPLGLSVGVLVLFVVVLSLHTALFAVLMRLHIFRFGEVGILLAAPTWVAVEIVQTHLIFGGFPWMLIGYALVPFGGIRQVVTVTGVYGLSFLAMTVASLVTFSMRARDGRPLAGALAIVVAAYLIPGPDDPNPGLPMPVRIVQTNIDLDQSWLPVDRIALLDELEALTTEGAPDVDLVVWPETPAPFYLSADSFFASRSARIARQLDAPLLAGYIDTIGELPSNSAGIVAPSGRQISRYDKIHLVPFGEYVPLRSVLFFAESMVRNVGDFAPGSSYTVSEVDGHRISTTICYEDVFPALVRQFTRRGAEVIVNITNDGWFGDSSAPYQHLRMSVVRATENRRYIVRGANTGISAIIDPYGNVVSSTPLGARTVLDGVAGYRSDLTFYVRYGDVFSYLMAAVTLGSVLTPGRSTKWDPYLPE